MADDVTNPPQTSSVEDDDTSYLPLTPRQRAFVREYLLDLNGQAAAIRAGYSSASAGSTGSVLLTLPHVARAVERALADRAARVAITADSVLQEMSLLANSSVEHYQISETGDVELAEGAPPGAMQAVKSIKRKVRQILDRKTGEVIERIYDVELQLWDKPGPLKLMGRHIGMFPDKVEVSGPGGKPLEAIGVVRCVIVDPAAEDAAGDSEPNP